MLRVITLEKKKNISKEMLKRIISLLYPVKSIDSIGNNYNIIIDAGSSLEIDVNKEIETLVEDYSKKVS